MVQGSTSQQLLLLARATRFERHRDCCFAKSVVFPLCRSGAHYTSERIRTVFITHIEVKSFLYFRTDKHQDDPTNKDGTAAGLLPSGAWSQRKRLGAYSKQDSIAGNVFRVVTIPRVVGCPSPRVLLCCLSIPSRPYLEGGEIKPY